MTPPQFHAMLQAEGLFPAMEALNRGVPHRYTGIFQVIESQLINVFLYDKQQQIRPEALAVVALDNSFCQFVLRDGSLLVDNSMHDERLLASSFRGVVVAYHGVPVPDRRGGLYGTLCHFDLVEQRLPSAQFELLQAAGGLLYPYLPHGDGRAYAAPQFARAAAG
ncbi:guanylate cyclase [Acidovorax sp. NCPPB 3576]|uniref:guanylate cyclase n=1 Tax=Acidovorax sp. NCPPB 3576 TaxID=2940488 RepID=UPI00234BAA01|nr:guanylate cyclase [Acidovorax sp. NCPPB 3576]WCM87502.1 guanylate cyclase [Acidovorax sp. NCPPB 3576]